MTDWNLNIILYCRFSPSALRLSQLSWMWFTTTHSQSAIESSTELWTAELWSKKLNIKYLQQKVPEKVRTGTFDMLLMRLRLQSAQWLIRGWGFTAGRIMFPLLIWETNAVTQSYTVRLIVATLHVIHSEGNRIMLYDLSYWLLICAVCVFV